MIRVQCDAPGCGWQEKSDTPREWHNKACPKCGVAPIVSDGDLAILDIIEEAASMGLIYDQDGEKAKAGLGVSITIDTSGLRNG